MAARCIFCDQCGMLLPEPTVAGVSVDCKLCGTMASASGAPRMNGIHPATNISFCGILLTVFIYTRVIVLRAVFEALVLTSSTVERTVEPDVADVDSLHQKQQQSQPVRAVVNEPCPKCKHPELQYYTMQCVLASPTRRERITCVPALAHHARIAHV